MKKILLIIIVFFSFMDKPLAKEELLINELKINNAEISPRFDKYNNYYSVTIDNNIESLEFEIDYNKDYFDIEIANNENLLKNKLVYVTIFDRETLEQNSYIFKISINKDDLIVSNVINEKENTDSNSKNDNYNYAPVIGTICFVIIIIVFKIMFL